MTVDHSGQESAAQIDHSGHIDLDEVEFLLRNRFCDESQCLEPGVVDQDVRNQTERRDPIWQARPRGSIGQVGGQRVRLRTQPSGELVKAVGAAGYQHHLIAAPRKYPGELFADS